MINLTLYETRPTKTKKARVVANYYGLHKKDVRVETFHGSSKVSVKVTHLPTGIAVHSKKFGYRSANRHEAFVQLVKKLGGLRD